MGGLGGQERRGGEGVWEESVWDTHTHALATGRQKEGG